MTRLGSPCTSGRFDLAQAFRFLGMAPRRHELSWVIDRLRESGVEELEFGDGMVETAKANGSSAIVALDLSSSFYFGVELPRYGRGAARKAS